MSRWLFVVMAVVMAVLGVAGCGGSPTPQTTADRPTATLPFLYKMAVVKTATPGGGPATAVVAGATPGAAQTVTATPRATASPPPAHPSPVPTASPGGQATVPRIDVAEAKARADAGQAILVDVRSAAVYEAQHIAGAISMPLAQVPSRYTELPTDRQVIFYCA